MLRFRPSRPGERSRRRAARALFIRHGIERTPEGRSLRLLRQWLSPAQRAQFAEKGHFEVVGGDTGKRYRIYAGAATNVCEVDENDARVVFFADGQAADRRRHAVPEDRTGKFREPRARSGQKIRSGRHVPARSAFSLRPRVNAIGFTAGSADGRLLFK